MLHCLYEITQYARGLYLRTSAFSPRRPSYLRRHHLVQRSNKVVRDLVPTLQGELKLQPCCRNVKNTLKSLIYHVRYASSCFERNTQNPRTHARKTRLWATSFPGRAWERGWTLSSSWNTGVSIMILPMMDNVAHFMQIY
jgi:hypothetical protein